MQTIMILKLIYKGAYLVWIVYNNLIEMIYAYNGYILSNSGYFTVFLVQCHKLPSLLRNGKRIVVGTSILASIMLLTADIHKEVK